MGAMKKPGPDTSKVQASSNEITILTDVRRSFELVQGRGSDLSVVVAGLDGFRAVNERLGPIEGDAVLAAFGACLGGTIENVTHLVADQLVGVLPGINPSRAIALAQGVRKDISDRVVTPVGRVTASFGVAAHPDSAESAEELVYGAQAAMYWAKAKGGNRVDYWGEMIGANTTVRSAAAKDPVTALAIAVEKKMRAAPGQLARSAWYAQNVAAEMGVGPQDQELIEKAALLHDVGMLAVPDGILHKPGSLSDGEKAIVRAHPAVGAKIVDRGPELAGTASIVAHHHEHYDGSGYPDGLAGDAIPLISRIILVSDAVDAMTTERSYRSVISLQEALEELHRCSGRQFDKRVVDAFTTIVKRKGLQALHWSQTMRQAHRI
jgi:diguanylate cyclase (GGDEF)-like protein